MRVDIKKNTDQLNYEDFLGGIKKIVTVTGVVKGKKEAQYDISIEGDNRVWRPPPTVLKLLVLAWTDDSTTWSGRRAELFGDPNVMFGREKVGGIRVSRVSHIDAPVTESLSETRGKRKPHTLHPLPDVPAAPAAPITTDITACTDRDTLRGWYRAHPDLRDVINQRVTDLDNEPGDA